MSSSAHVWLRQELSSITGVAAKLATQTGKFKGLGKQFSFWCTITAVRLKIWHGKHRTQPIDGWVQLVAGPNFGPAPSMRFDVLCLAVVNCEAGVRGQFEPVNMRQTSHTQTNMLIKLKTKLNVQHQKATAILWFSRNLVSCLLPNGHIHQFGRHLLVCPLHHLNIPSAWSSAKSMCGHCCIICIV